jgi:AraC-like DNA-binding protein
MAAGPVGAVRSRRCHSFELAVPQLIDVTGLPLAAERRPTLPLAAAANRVMWLNDERVFYAGLLGDMTERCMGGWHVYVSLGEPIRLALDGGPWQTTDLAVVPPYVRHRVACDERLIADVVIEPELVDPQGLPDFIRLRSGAVHDETAVVRRVRELHSWLCVQGQQASLSTADVDEFLFGHPLAPRRLDARIARVLDTLRADPAAPLTAAECAAEVGLSFSRFLHLFKQETGVSFRHLRAWKRARSLLHHVTRAANLVHVALDTGYPDSTHFSHSIRQVYGLKPRDLFAGSRQLKVLGDSPAALAARRADNWR